MSKRILWTGLLLAAVLLSGCSRAIVFNGESDDWRVVCTVSTWTKTKEYDIRYIGFPIYEPYKVKYAFEGSQNFHANGTNDVSAKKKLRITSSGTMETPYVNESDFMLHISWNGQEQTIKLAKQ